jgi:HlyD family secretion protein
MKKRKNILWISISTVVVVLVWATFFRGGNENLVVKSQKIALRDITELVTVTGKIQPRTEVKISADVSGEITEMWVSEGDSVKKGQLLLTINPEIYITTVNQLIANLNNARASLASAEAQELRAKNNFKLGKDLFKRQEFLYKDKVISLQDFENATLQFQQQETEVVVASKSRMAASFNVKSLEARVEEGQKTLGRTRITAPQSGIVTQLSSEKGERVVGTAQMAGTEIMRISNLDVMEVEVQINENDIVRVHLNDEADIRVDAYPERIFKGKVTEIANSAKFNVAQNMSEQVTNYTVKILIDANSYRDLIKAGRPQPFLPGMTASADIKTEIRSKVLSLPISAVTTRNVKNSESENAEGKTWVFLYNGGKAKAVEVKTGIQDIDYFEVISGLKEGDEIITEPGMAVAKTLMDGSPISKEK